MGGSDTVGAVPVLPNTKGSTMNGTVSGMLPEPDSDEERVKKVQAWFKVKKSLTRRALVGIAFAGAIAGGVLESHSQDAQVQDLQAQIAAMQNVSDSTGAGAQGVDGGTLVSKKQPGHNGVKHPKALSPGRYKYVCTRQNVG